MKNLYLLLLILLSSFSINAQNTQDYNILNGTLMRESESPSTPTIYLIIEGKKCRIPNLVTMRILFEDGVKVQYNLGVKLIPDGEPLSDGAVLVKAFIPKPPDLQQSKQVQWASDAIFLVSNGKKMRISSIETFGKYNFRIKSEIGIPLVVLDAIPAGPVLK